MAIKVNFEDVEVTDFEALPAGTYHVKITDGEIKESGPDSKNPGAEYINWELTIQDGEYESRKLWTNTSLLAHALFSLKGMFAATGKWTKQELSAPGFEFDIDDAIGLSLKVRVTQRMY